MTSISQEEEFTEVTHGRKKRKASNSPTLLSQPKPGSSDPTLGTPVRPKSSYKNKIPVIISFLSSDNKFKNWRQLMGELRQYHPSLKVYQGTPKRRFCSHRRLSSVRRDYLAK